MSDIVSSLQCRGSADVDAPRLQSIALADSLRDVAIRPGTSLFHDASAAFTCANGKIQFHDFALIDPSEEIDGAGSVDFSPILDFRLSVVRDSALSSPPDPQEDTPAPTPGAVSYELSGPLSSPQTHADFVVAPPRPLILLSAHSPSRAVR